MRARAVTGVGIVSPLGTGRDAFFKAMRSTLPPEPAGAIDAFDATAYPAARVAQVPSFDPAKVLGDRGLRTLDRLTKLLVVAARLGLHDAALKKDGVWSAPPPSGPTWPERVGIVVSNAYGSLEAIHELDQVALLEDPRYINPARFPLTVSNSAAGYASIWEDVRALNVSVSNGNCGGLDAVACADMLLESSRADVLLVGGVEALSEPLFVAFARLGVHFDSNAAMAHQASGCLGEGAALLAIETLQSCRARGAERLAEIVGYGTSFVAPPRGSLFQAGGEALKAAIEMALGDASLGPRDIDVVVSGVSGIQVFDHAELDAIGKVLDPSMCITAPKLGLGESLGAGGAFGMASAVSYFDADDWGWVVQGRPRRRPRAVLVTSLGYYGNASALVMRSPSE